MGRARLCCQDTTSFPRWLFLSFQAPLHFFPEPLALYIFNLGLEMEVSRFVKSYLHTAQLNRINIQMLKPLRMFPNKNEDDFLIISELKKKNTKMKPQSCFHRNFNRTCILPRFPHHLSNCGCLVEAEDTSTYAFWKPLKCE